ncbi:MAG: dihydrodipicolinate synthase family protein [bacterium]|nr:dihydrodipicolinate synthase family protein [bacterium]
MADKTWVMPDGVYTALVTPFTADGAVDRAAWRRLVQRQVDGGVAGVVPAGCTGEAAVLTREEREWLVRTAVEVCKGRCAVVAGSGSNCTRESLSQTRDVKAWGRRRGDADLALLQQTAAGRPARALPGHCTCRRHPAGDLQRARPHGRQHPARDRSTTRRRAERGRAQGSKRQPRPDRGRHCAL